MKNLTLFAIFCLSLFGCGGSDSNDPARIVDLFLDNRNIAVGNPTVVRAEFSFSNERVFDDRDDIFLVMRLPAEVAFREDSAEIQGDFNDEDVSPLVTTCGDGQETFLRFRFDDEDLRGAEDPDGAADAQLALTIDALSTSTATPIQAAAANQDIPFTCGEPFLADEEVLLSIS